MENQSFDKFFADNHLKDEAIALFVDALILNKVELLIDEIRTHVEDCTQCKMGVFALYEIIKQDNKIQDKYIHPFLN